MKLQYLAVVFIIIFLPILLVTTYYVQQQMETINVQLEYDAALLDATHDAMLAFEINTANESLSTVSDSLRSIIEASNNIFLNTLAVNFGVSNASKSVIQPYVPAVVYTLYDGYYIYAPTKSPIICTDKYGHTITTDSLGVTFVNATSGHGVYKFTQDSLEYDETLNSTLKSGYNENDWTVDYDDLEDNDISSEYGQMLYENEKVNPTDETTYSTVLHDNTKYKTSYILKSYIPYAAQYTDNSTFDITINYTLDNYMTILGDINGIYYSKSGYLIDDNLIKEIIVNGNSIEWDTYSDDELYNMVCDSDNYIVEIVFNPTAHVTNEFSIKNTDNDSWDDVKLAMLYYSKAWTFSKWIYSTEILNNLKERDIEDKISELVNEAIRVNYKNVDEVSENLLYDFEASSKFIFQNVDPEDFESTFAEHKRNVIKNSITYNLSLTMNVYNKKYSGMEFQMPVLSEEEWDKLLSNVSILTFMQGLRCGYKTYNNYALVCSTNNEITVTPEEIYYTNYTTSLNDISKTETDDEGNDVVVSAVETVHRINCPKLEESDYYTSIKAKEIKYDKNYNSNVGVYDYDHKVYTCYDCIVNPNYIGISGWKNGTDYSIPDSLAADTEEANLKLLRAYYIAIGKERQNLYKPTAVSENTAIEIINFKNNAVGTYNVDASTSNPVTFKFSSNVESGAISKSTYPINQIAKIDLIFADTCKDSGNSYLYTTPLLISLNAQSALSYNQVVIPVNSITTKTIELSGSFESDEYLESLGLSFGSSAVNLNIKSIKIYYK